MSCDIRKYKSMDVGGHGQHEMTLTAFVGPNGNRCCIQFTIGDQYCALTEQALSDMIDVIRNRLMREDGYTATGDERDDIEFKEINN
jgi:hypothetical protein